MHDIKMSVVNSSHLWAVSCLGLLAAVPCLPLVLWIRDAQHYRHAIEPLLGSSPDATHVLERWSSLEALDVQSVLRASRVFRATLYGLSLTVLLSRYDSYGPERLINDQLGYNLTAHRVQEGGLILDVGGNVGVTAILLAKLNPTARVLTLEPLPPNRFYLELNLALNGLARDGRVDVLAAAVSSRGGDSVSMSYNPEVPAASGRYWAASGLFRRSPGQVFQVRTTTIEAILKDAGAPRIDLMKLDCEGCEYEVVPALTESVLDQTGYAVGDVHLHYAHLFNPQTSRAVHAALCGRGWGITHLLCSPSDQAPLLEWLRQMQLPP